MKAAAGFRKSRYVGQARTGMAAFLVGAAYNLLRIEKLQAARSRGVSANSRKQDNTLAKPHFSAPC